MMCPGYPVQSPRPPVRRCAVDRHLGRLKIPHQRDTRIGQASPYRMHTPTPCSPVPAIRVALATSILIFIRQQSQAEVDTAPTGKSSGDRHGQLQSIRQNLFLCYFFWKSFKSCQKGRKSDERVQRACQRVARGYENTSCRITLSAVKLTRACHTHA